MTYLETSVYRILTLSPIHIRAGEPRLYGQGFIRLNNDDFLYVVDTPKLQAAIFAFKGLEAVDTYTKAFSNPNSRTDITQILDRIGYDYKSNIKKISNGIVRLPSGNRFMQSGLGQHFIPGSSIKGAIKTAVLYNSVKQQIADGSLDLNDFVEKQITQYQRQRNTYNKRKFREALAEKLIENAFQSKHPRERSQNQQRHPERSGPFTDIFKTIKVKDSIIEKTSINLSQFAKTITPPGSDGATVKTLEGSEVHLPFDRIIENLKKGITTSLKEGEWIKIDTFEEKDGNQIVATFTKVAEPTLSRIQFEDILFTTLQENQVVTKEMDGNTRFECFHGETSIEISIDHEILDSFKRAGARPPFSDLESLIQLCQNFAQAQWKAEQQFLADYGNGGSLNLDEIKTFYTDDKSEKHATLRVGWGTGMLGTTISLLLDEDVRIKLRNKVISADGGNRPQPAPKSRRFVLENSQPAYPLGWIALT